MNTVSTAANICYTRIRDIDFGLDRASRSMEFCARSQRRLMSRVTGVEDTFNREIRLFADPSRGHDASALTKRATFALVLVLIVKQLVVAHSNTQRADLGALRNAMIMKPSSLSLPSLLPLSLSRTVSPTRAVSERGRSRKTQNSTQLIHRMTTL